MSIKNKNVENTDSLDSLEFEKKDLTQIKGIGSVTAEKLRNEGIQSPAHLRFLILTPTRTLDIDGFGEEKIKKLVPRLRGFDLSDDAVIELIRSIGGPDDVSVTDLDYDVDDILYVLEFMVIFECNHGYERIREYLSGDEEDLMILDADHVIGLQKDSLGGALLGYQDGSPRAHAEFEHEGTQYLAYSYNNGGRPYQNYEKWRVEGAGKFLGYDPLDHQNYEHISIGDSFGLPVVLDDLDSGWEVVIAPTFEMEDDFHGFDSEDSDDEHRMMQKVVDALEHSYRNIQRERDGKRPLPRDWHESKSPDRIEYTYRYGFHPFELRESNSGWAFIYDDKEILFRGIEDKENAIDKTFEVMRELNDLVQGIEDSPMKKKSHIKQDVEYLTKIDDDVLFDVAWSLWEDKFGDD